MSAQVTSRAATAAPFAPERRRLRAPVAFAGGVAALAATLAVRSPYDSGSYGFCPFLTVTGHYCPGCGGLRAMHDLLRLDVAAAWDMNPLVVVAVPLVVAGWLVWMWRAWRGRPATAPSSGAVVLLAAVLLVFTVARNVPVLAPWLAP